jgi:hypothetical protein
MSEQWRRRVWVAACLVGWQFGSPVIAENACPVEIVVEGARPLSAANLKLRLVSKGVSSIDIVKRDARGFVVESYKDGPGGAECTVNWQDSGMIGDSRPYPFDRPPLLPCPWDSVASDKGKGTFVIAPGRYRVRISFVSDQPEDRNGGRRKVWTVYSPVFRIEEESNWAEFK